MIVKRAITTTLIVATVIAVPLQIVIDPSAENMAASMIVCVSALATMLYIICSKALDEQPLSTFAIFGFSFTTQMGALLVQTASWVPLRASLYNPVGTFATLAFYLGIAIAVHALYRYFSGPNAAKEGIARQLLADAGIYLTPSSGALWCMGFIGVVGMFLTRYENIVGRIAQWFAFMAWAPFLIPLYLREIGDSYCNAVRNRIFIAVFAFFVVLVGLAFNVRGIMLTGFTTVALLYLLAAMRSDAPVTGRAMGWVAVGTVFVVIISAPLADLATSMVIARQWRGKVSGAVMVSTTLHVFNQPALIAAYREQAAASARFKAYDEHYIDNPLLARLINTKYVDNALHFAAGIKTESAVDDLRQVSVKFLWSTLPAPLLKPLGIGVDKDALDFSMGDYLAYLSRGLPLGSHRLGSMFAQGQVLFGPAFPFLDALICLCVYIMMDLLTIRHRGGPATLSTVGMLLIWSFFVGGLSYEALHVVFTFLIRYFVQILILYFLVFTMIRIAAGMFSPLVLPYSRLPRTQ